MSEINWTNVIIELIGTFVFLTVIFNVAMKGHGGAVAPVAIGIGLIAAIYMFNSDSASNHYNPAVSFMAYLNGNIIIGTFLAYVAAQVIGASLAYAVHKYAVLQ